MKPIMPQLEVGQPVTVAKDQPQYLPLPAEVVHRERGTTVVTRWQFTAKERHLIATGEDLYLAMLTFTRPVQPLFLTVGPLDMRDYLGSP